MNTRVLTVKDLSNYLKVHSSTIYRLLKAGQLPGFSIGSDWRFNIEEIDRWRTGQTADGTNSQPLSLSKPARGENSHDLA
jgi:putative molybdopterin biosynthesis protein